jgi:NADH-quinone oxidoreductase subunit F
MGTTYRELIFGEKYGNGVANGMVFKALLPSGGSAPIITEEALDAPLTFEGLEEYGSLLGSASLIVMDETVDMVWAAMKLIHFFNHESCGKCTPCREGTFWLEKIYLRILSGNGRENDIKLLESVAKQMLGETLCALGDFATSPVLSTIKYFPEEYYEKVTRETVPERVLQPS